MFWLQDLIFYLFNCGNSVIILIIEEFFGEVRVGVGVGWIQGRVLRWRIVPQKPFCAYAWFLIVSVFTSFFGHIYLWISLYMLFELLENVNCCGVRNIFAESEQHRLCYVWAICSILLVGLHSRFFLYLLFGRVILYCNFKAFCEKFTTIWCTKLKY